MPKKRRRVIEHKIRMYPGSDPDDALILWFRSMDNLPWGERSRIVKETLLRGIDARLYNHVHDEIILSVAEGDQEQAAQALERAMIAGFLEIFPEGGDLVNGLVEVKTGANWAQTK